MTEETSTEIQPGSRTATGGMVPVSMRWYHPILGHAATLWVLPTVCLLLLVILTSLITREQLRARRALEIDHVNDVATLTARRLDERLTSQLAGLEVFAGRFEDMDPGDLADGDATELASLMLAELPGYRALGVFTPEGRPRWVREASEGTLTTYLAASGAAWIAAVRRGDSLAVSAPVEVEPGVVGVLVGHAMPALEGQQRILVVLLAVDDLVGDILEAHTSSSLRLALRDGETVLVGAAPGPPQRGETRVEETIAVGERRWVLSVSSVAGTTPRLGFQPHHGLAVFGLALAVGLSLALHLLLRGMQALQRSEQRYRDVLRTTNDGLILLDSRGRVLDVNDASRRLLGIPPGGDPPGSIVEVLEPTHRGTYLEFFSLIEQHGVARLESVVAGAGSAPVAVEIRGTRTVHGGRPAILAVLTDVSERWTEGQRQAELARHAFAAHEAERTRLSRELHDDLGQLLTGMRMQLDLLRLVHPRISAGAPEELGTLYETVDTARTALRRLCKGLRPPSLDDLGLVPALRQLVREFEELGTVTVISSFNQNPDRPAVSGEAALAVYRTLQEALTNVRKYAGADTLWVALDRLDGFLVLSIHDDGHGLPPGAAGNGFGLLGMRERAEMAGGGLVIESAAELGTKVTLRVPLDSASGQEES